LSSHPLRDSAGDVAPVSMVERVIGWVLAIGGAAGSMAAFILVVEKVALLEDPAYIPCCSLNPILSCGSVMSASQAEVFGFPNPLIGVATLPIVATLGVAVLAGARLPRWMWLSLQAGTVAGLVFVHWLIYQSLYRIGALCPYCMVVWLAMITIFWYTTLYNLRRGHLPITARLSPVVGALIRNHTVTLTLWLLGIVVLIGIEFWDFWATLLP
jgi:uncharacterized membrane protein